MRRLGLQRTRHGRQKAVLPMVSPPHPEVAIRYELSGGQEMEKVTEVGGFSPNSRSDSVETLAAATPQEFVRIMPARFNARSLEVNSLEVSC